MAASVLFMENFGTIPSSGASAPSAPDVPGTVRVAIVDDHSCARDGLALQVGRMSGCTVVAMATDGVDFLEQLRAGLEVHIALVDMIMPRMDGPQLMQVLCAHYPHIRLLAQSFYNDEATQLLAMRAGAHGFHTKAHDEHLLERAITSIMRTGYYHTEELHALLLKNPGGFSAEDRRRQKILDALTQRELQVMELVARPDGPPSKQIAHELDLSKSTVDNHIKSACDKFGGLNRWAAAAELKAWGAFKKREGGEGQGAPM